MLRPLEALCTVVIATAALGAGTGNSAAKHIARAAILREGLDHEKALEELAQAKRISRDFKDDLAIALYEGVVRGELDDWDAAKTAFRRALQLDINCKLPVKTVPRIDQLLEEMRAQIKPPQTVPASLPLPPPPIPSRPPPARVATPEVSTEPGPTIPGTKLFHVRAAAFGDLVSKNLGAEVLAGVRGPLWEARLGAVLGGNIGVQLEGGAHVNVAGPLALHLLLRAVVHPISEGIAWGGGPMVGTTVAVGPGRATASLGAQIYQVPSSYLPYALFLSGGYELDL